MLQVIIEPSAYVNMVAGFESSQPQLRFILPKIALFFDLVHVFGEIHEIDKRIDGFGKIAFVPMELISESQIFVKYQIRAKEYVRSFTYCEAGDILLAKITPCLENGKQGIVPYDAPNGFVLATTEVFPIRCKGVDTLFLFYVLKFAKFRNKIIASMTGTTGRQRASKESVLELEVPLPPLPEQRKIAETLLHLDNVLQLKERKKEKLVMMKKRLMNLLLTGKVRVTI